MAKKDALEILNKEEKGISKIETIRDLIFGDNMTEYNSEFESLKKDLRAKRQELEDFIEATKKELHHAIDNLGTDVNIRITDLEDALTEKTDQLVKNKVDRKTLGNLLKQMGETITNA